MSLRGKASHNASNDRGVTAGKMGRNSSTDNGRSMPYLLKECLTRGEGVIYLPCTREKAVCWNVERIESS